ncbi:MAG TPA: helix-turn-helix transcriptional regulator [Armatimonadota bacterium]|nr:helix-turn-helix transcriptional regulator [Armatimonadota bacterium]
MSARRAEFGRRFREITRAEKQEEVAERLGISQSYVSRMGRGLPPGPAILERIIQSYGLPRTEWRELAGYGEEASEEEWITAIAARAAEEALRRAGFPPLSGAQRLVEGVQELNRRYGRPVPIDLSGGLSAGDSLTVEQAEAVLRDLEQQLDQGLI